MSSVLTRLAETVRAGPEATALLADGQACSYGDLDEQARVFAGQLAAVGVGPGDRVALMLPNGVAFSACYYGALLAGAVVVPLNPRASAERALACIADCTPSVLVCPRADVASAAAGRGTRVVDGSAEGPGGLSAEAPPLDAAPERSDSELAAVIYGLAEDEPRGVAFSHGNLAAAAETAAAALGIEAGDGVLNGFPQFLALGQTCGMLAVLGSRGYMVTAEALTPRAIVTLVVAHGVRAAGILPGVVRPLLGEPGRAEAAASLRTLLCCGGATLDERTARRATAALDCGLVEGYGPPQAAGVATLTPPRGARGDEPGSLGRAVPDSSLRVTDERHREAPAGELGHVQLAGPLVSPGYWQQPEASARSRHDGWVDTGDSGWLDPGGHLFLAEGPGWTQLLPGQGLGRSLKRAFGRHAR